MVVVARGGVARASGTSGISSVGRASGSSPSSPTVGTVTAATTVNAVSGALFRASSNDLVYRFDYAGDPQSVVIDLADARVWDAPTVATLNAITSKYAAKGKHVTVVNLNDDSARRHELLAGQLS